MDIFNHLVPGPIFLNVLVFFSLAAACITVRALGFRAQRRCPFLASLYFAIAIICLDFVWALFLLPARQSSYEDYRTRNAMEWLLALAKAGSYVALLILFVRDLNALRLPDEPEDPPPPPIESDEPLDVTAADGEYAPPSGTQPVED